MARAIELASGAHTHPNPRVGAVVVAASGEVVGEGRYEGPGTPHAELIALSHADDHARGSTVFVTLEPCNHHGRTPPCVDALIAAGVARVVAAVTDPDRRTDGRGFERLRAEGIEVEVGTMEEEAMALDPAYFHHRRTGLPLVTWKYAMTLDGSVAAMDRSSRWITSEEARADAHRLRAGVDAVVIGTGTLSSDDPILDVRLPGHDGPQPRPVIVLGRSEPPTRARLWTRDPLVYSTVERSIPSGDLVVVDGEAHPDPTAVCLDLGERGLLDVLLEGGPTLAGEWWRARVVARGVAYLGAKVGGGVGMPPMSGVFSRIEDARVVSVSDVRSLGDDVRIDFMLQDVHGNR